MPQQHSIAKITAALLAGVLAGCDSGSPNDGRQPRTRPVVETPASVPAVSQPVTQPATTKPADPEIPEYFKVVSRFDSAKAVQFQSRVEPGNRLVIQTRNVRRLRIERAALPLAADKRIILHLDDQGIEWTASSRVIEFERSLSGVWQPVRPEREPVPAGKSEKP